MDIPLLTPESLATLGVQAAVIACLVAILRQIVPDTVKTIYVALPTSIVVVVVSAFLSDIPAKWQTGIVAVLQAIVLVSLAYGANQVGIRAQAKLAPPTTPVEVAAAADGSERAFFRPWT